MSKKMRRGISMKQRMAIVNSWLTEHGKEYLSTGPITWAPLDAFDRLGKYGWDVARVNDELTDALYENCRDLVYQIVDDLVEEAREEWEERKHASESTPHAE